MREQTAPRDPPAPAPSLCVATLAVDSPTVGALRELLARSDGRLLGEFYDYALEGDASLAEAMQSSPLPVWLIGFDCDRTMAAAAASRLHQRLQGRGYVIAVSANAEPAMILEAVRSGCCEYLTSPATVEQLSEAFDRLRGRIRLPGAALAAKSGGQMILMLGVRGGAGTTTLAVHMASFLARQYGKKTLIVDVHRRMGHVSLYLGHDASGYHFYELVRNLARLDDALLEGFVTHYSPALDLLPSPDCVDDSANVSLDHIQHALRFIAQHYEFVVIDCPHGVHNLSLAAIDCCDLLYLVATPDVPALRDLSRVIDHLMQSGVSPDKVRVVINRFSSAGALSLEQIEKGIRRPVAVTVPNASADLIRAMNTGAPVPPEHKSEFAIQMKKWALSLGGVLEPPPAEPRRRFAFWKRMEPAALSRP